MATLILKTGENVLVDDEDFYWINQWRWQAISIKNKKYVFRSRRNNHLGYTSRAYLHRIVMRTEDKHLIVDHINGNTLDNRKENLRICTKSENNKNTSSHKNSSSIYLGVSYDKLRKKWNAQLKHNGLWKLAKRYNTEEEAAKAYDIAAKEHFGEFANLNFK